MSAVYSSLSSPFAMPPPETVEPASRSRPESVTTSMSARRRRDKPQLSCNLCRKRKLRCDRQQPACSVCSTRGLTCTYADNRAFALAASRSLEIENTPALSLRDRTVQLERLVQSLAPGPNYHTGTAAQHPGEGNVDRTGSIGSHGLVNSSPAGTPVDERSEAGSMRLSSSEVRFLGSEHWTAIMDSIAELKDYFEQDEENRMMEGSNYHRSSDTGPVGRSWPSSTHASLLYHVEPAHSRMDIIAALPPKDAVDRYVSRFFNSMDLVASSAVHGPTFLQEYEQFWKKPSSEMSIIWVGLLFGMICLAVLASDTSTNPMPSIEIEQQRRQVDLYRQKIVQCLIMGEYTRAAPYVLETIINYVYIEFLIPNDANQDLWYLLSLEVSLAMKMGYHRDPSHFPGITPIQAEMRRRLWSTVLLGDALISSQMGMPCMINESVYDTAEPRNLNDDDLLENVELMPSRPETEHTTALGIIARRRVVVALRKVCELTASIQPCSYDEIMRIDRIVQEASTSIPPPLRNKLMANSITDSPHVIMARLFLSHLVSKCQIMLHRRFLFQDQDMYIYSRTTCLNAALVSLEIQAVLDQEMCPGGQLHTMRFRVGSLLNHHFLSATMILCSLIHRQREPIDRREETLSALRRARMIWMRRSAVSREAKKAAETISIVLGKRVTSEVSQQPAQATSQQGISTNNGSYGQIASATTSPFGQYPIDPTNSGMTSATEDLLQEMDFISAGFFTTPEPLGADFSPASHNQQAFNLITPNTNVTMEDWARGLISPHSWQ